MKTDQDLIFEAYTKTLNENYSEVDSIFDELESFMRKNPETENELSPILNNLLDTIEALQKFDIDEDNIENVENFVFNLRTANNQLQSFMRKNPETESGLSPILNELDDTIDELDGHLTGEQLDGVELGGIINRLAPVYEAYTKTLNENNDSGILEQLEIFMSNNPATRRELAPILNELLEVAEELVRFDEFMDGEDQDEYLYLLNKLSTTART
jgi:DNA-binding ferritin-like protein (Dps family)